MSKVVEKFRTGDLSPAVDLARIRLDEDAPAREWTWNNRVMAYAQTGDADVRGYNQWQDAGRHVKKGEKAAYILAPRMATVEDEDGEESQECWGFFGIAVFGFSQTEPNEGDEDTLTYEPQEPPELLALAERFDVTVEFSPKVGALGSTRGDGSEIVLGSEEPGVFFHELGHAVHAQLNGKLKGGQHTEQEAVAELVSCVLMELYGYGDRTGNAWDYISGYSEQPLQAIMRAMGDVEQVLKKIDG